MYIAQDSYQVCFISIQGGRANGQLSCPETHSVLGRLCFRVQVRIWVMTAERVRRARLHRL